MCHRKKCFCFKFSGLTISRRLISSKNKEIMANCYLWPVPGALRSLDVLPPLLRWNNVRYTIPVFWHWCWIAHFLPFRFFSICHCHHNQNLYYHHHHHFILSSFHTFLPLRILNIDLSINTERQEYKIGTVCVGKGICGRGGINKGD
jgi:hypothetical protein